MTQLIPGTVDALNELLESINYTLDIRDQATIDNYVELINAAAAAVDNVSTVLIATGSKLYLEDDGQYTYLRGFNPFKGILEESVIRDELEVYGDNTHIVIVPVKVVNTDDDGFGTGTRVQHYDGNVLVKEYIVVVDGDINGDSVTDSYDMAMMNIHINELTEPGMDENYNVVNPWFNIAADLSKDGVIDIIDFAVIIGIVNYDCIDLYE